MNAAKAFFRIHGNKLSACAEAQAEGYVYFRESRSEWAPAVVVMHGGNAFYDVIRVSDLTPLERGAIIQGEALTWVKTLLETSEKFWSPVLSKSYGAALVPAFRFMTGAEKVALLIDLGLPPKFAARARYLLYICLRINKWAAAEFSAKQAAAETAAKGFPNVTEASLKKDIQRGFIPPIKLGVGIG